MNTENYIKKRFAQDINEEQLDLLGVPEKCRSCPMVAIKYVEQRNESIDAVARTSRQSFERVTELLKDFRSPVSNTAMSELHDAVDEFGQVVDEAHATEDFYSNLAQLLTDKGMHDCEGMVEPDEGLIYPRRYTRDSKGQPVDGLAIALCAQDTTYVRGETGYADVSLKPIAIK